MSAIPNPAQSEFSKGSLPVKSLVEVLATDTADLENAPDAIALAAPAAPSPDQQVNAMSLDAVRQSVDSIATGQEQIMRSVDRVAPSVVASQEQMTRSIDRIDASQEQIARGVDQLTVGQEQMTREITKLHEIEQYILYKNSRPAPAPTCNPVPRPSQAPTVR